MHMGTHSYSRRAVYLHYKISQNQTKNIPEVPYQKLWQICEEVPELSSGRDYKFIYIYKYIKHIKIKSKEQKLKIEKSRPVA